LARVELREVAKVYRGGIEAIRPLDLAIEPGSYFVVVGPSGSGKSTLLRLIAGLESPSAGTIWIDGRRADGLPPRDRDLAMVFQTPVVYPFLSVFENLAFGLRARPRVAAESRAERRAHVNRAVAEVAAALGLTELLGRRPATLSGGQRQRLALGRALVRRPRAFLLDEPLASLDLPLRAALRTELAGLHQRFGTTVIHVTHDQAEALALGTRIAVLNQGRIVQCASPGEVYDNPASRFVASFIGSPPMSILRCDLERARPGLRLRLAELPGEAAWAIADGAHWASPLRQRGAGPVDLGIRAEHVRIVEPSGGQSPELVAHGVVARLEPLGHEVLATLAVGAHRLTLRLGAHSPIGVGETMAVGLSAEAIAWFDADSGERLRAAGRGSSLV
jgi:ABC-type sugar transport system ATPase subunit